MKSSIIAAIFSNPIAADRAVKELCAIGIPSDNISVIEAHDGASSSGTIGHGGDTKASGTGKGLLAGGALGAIAALGALVIPGVGPFIAGGAIAQALGGVGSAIAVSGAVGAAAGGLSAALIDYGIDRHEAEFYEQRIRQGDVFVSADTRGHHETHAAVQGILRAAGGESAWQHGREHA